jgi:hypothetical protein
LRLFLYFISKQLKLNPVFIAGMIILAANLMGNFQGKENGTVSDESDVGRKRVYRRKD